MNKHIPDNLKNALEAKTPIAFVFGAGISSGLTGVPYGWPRWLSDGISRMNPGKETDELRKCLSDTSAENLVRIAGKVIPALKANHRYDKWMSEAFEDKDITNTDLAEALRYLRTPQDIFLTTNYDRLLEAAAGLDTLTRDEPGRVFAVLESGIDRAVVHIHGLYDSKNGIDNIVATEEQYTELYRDEGAQFIQNLIGTRTLILIGCGQTTEDVNISRFISFAKDKLKIERSCFFLGRTSEASLVLPDNFTFVPYGDAYDDLAPFLRDMGRARWEDLMVRNPFVAIVPSHNSGGTHADAFGLDEYHFASELIPFSGRRPELAKLREFSEDNSHFAWWAITGQAGSGKSRLAYEFLKHIGKEYFGFFLNPEYAVEIKNFEPFCDTFIAIDYVQGNEKSIAEAVHNLYLTFSITKFRLRILFIERGNDAGYGSWFYELAENFAPIDRAVFLDAEYNADHIVRRHRFIYLEDLDDEAVLTVISSVCKTHGLPEDPGRDRELKHSYAEKLENLHFRPLFLQLFVENWIASGQIQASYQNSEQLIESLITREQERWLSAVGGDKKACAALIRLLVRASAGDGLSLDDLPELYRDDFKCVKEALSCGSFPGKQRQISTSIKISDAGQELYSSAGELEPRYPDIFKEYMFLFYTEEDRLPAVVTELWEHAGKAFSGFLARSLMDFPDSDVLKNILKSSSARGDELSALNARLALLEYHEAINPGDDPVQLITEVREEYDFWLSLGWDKSFSPGKKECILRGLYASAKRLRGWQLIDESISAVRQILSHADDDDVAETAYGLAADRITAFTDEIQGGGFEIPEQLFAETMPGLKARKEHWAKILSLRLYRDHLINEYGKGNKDKAADAVFALRESDQYDLKDTEWTEAYCYLICSMEERVSQDPFSMKHLLELSDLIQDIIEEIAGNQTVYHMNDRIHYYYLKSKFMSMEKYVAMATLVGNVSDDQFRELLKMTSQSQYDLLISEIESNVMFNELSGIYVGALAVKTAYDETVTDEDVNGYIDKAFSLSQTYTDNELLCSETITLVDAAYTEQFKRKVQRDLLDRCYALLLRFPNSEEALHEFGNVLRGSTEKARWKDYLNRKEVLTGLIQNNMLDDIIYDMTRVETVRRTVMKIMPNDPCPCGSGKKFKKCCKGKGIYD